MDFKFNENINNFLKIILKNAQKQNIRVFFVGGLVRDKFLNKKTFDIDLLITSNAIDFAKSLENKIKIKSIHEDFATVKVEYKNIEIDIASSRTEEYPKSGCLPIVKKIGVTLEEDVIRRDFKINSLYCELKLENEKINYTLIDLTEGIKDIQNKVLSALHSKSYIDDPTRIVRGIEFKHRFGFDFSQSDKKLINNYLNNIDYTSLSFDRCLKVFKRAFNNAYSSEIFEEIANNKYYKIIQQNDINFDFNQINKAITLFSLKQNHKAEFYINLLQNNAIDLIKCNSLLDIKNVFSKFSQAELAYYFYKTNDENIIHYLKIKKIELNISGKDLINLGFKQGKNIGIILNKLLTAKMKNPNLFKTRRSEINWIRENFPIV